MAPYRHILGPGHGHSPLFSLRLFQGKLQSHTVRNLHFLSKNSTLISRENCKVFGQKFDFSNSLSQQCYWKRTTHQVSFDNISGGSGIREGRHFPARSITLRWESRTR